MRHEHMKRKAEWDSAEVARKANKRDVSSDQIREMEGGKIGTGEEETRLAPLALLSLRDFDLIDWSKTAARKNKWSMAVISNQLKLRNLPEMLSRRSAPLAALLQEKQLLANNEQPDSKLLTSADSRKALVAKLKVVLQAEQRAVQQAAVLQGVNEEAAVEESRRSRSERAGRNVPAPRMGE